MRLGVCSLRFAKNRLFCSADSAYPQNFNTERFQNFIWHNMIIWYVNYQSESQYTKSRPYYEIPSAKVLSA